MDEYRFGEEEKVKCIADVTLELTKGEALCVAYKTRTRSFVAPLYMRDDGYVLGVRAAEVGKYYPMPVGGELESLQDAGLLPRPLPSYEISTFQYISGHLVPVVIVVMIALGLGSRWRKRRRHDSLQSSEPPSTDPPQQRTKLDRWLAEEARRLLQPGEAVQQQAYGFDAESTDADMASTDSALYAVLTDHRLLFIKARVGAFGPLKENKGVFWFPRNDVVRVEALERRLTFVLANGHTQVFFAQWHERNFTNQKRFLRDVPRLLQLPGLHGSPLLSAAEVRR